MNPSAEKVHVHSFPHLRSSCLLRLILRCGPLVLTSLLCGGQHWVTERGAFQKKLLARMRGLGMTAVLSSFSGHIPKAFADKHPEAKIRRSPNWGLQQRIFLSLLCQRSDVGQVWSDKIVGRRPHADGL